MTTNMNIIDITNDVTEIKEDNTMTKAENKRIFVNFII